MARKLFVWHEKLELQYSNDTVEKRDLIFSSLKSKLNLKTNESPPQKMFIFAKLEIILKPLSRIAAEGF